MRIALFSSNTSFFANEVTKSHTKKPRRNQEKGRRGQKSETIFIFYMTFSRQGRVEARFTLLFWLIEKVQCFDVKMLFLRSERGFYTTTPILNTLQYLRDAISRELRNALSHITDVCIIKKPSSGGHVHSRKNGGA